MVVFKNSLTPIGGKKGHVTVHQGKGSQQQPLSTHNNVSQSGSAQPGAGINNYAKATPMPGPSAPAADGLGSGDWPGVAG